MIARSALLYLFTTSAWAADLPAQLDWSQRLEVSSSVSGLIESVQVRPGQRVEQGSVLFSLNPTLFKAGLMEARADLERLTQEEIDARRELDRAKELYARTVSSTTELDAAKLRHARAGSLLKAAEARAEKARRLLEESEPRAPFNAIVLDRSAEPGMAVAASCQPPTLLILARADEMLARASLDATRAAGLQPGARAKVDIAGKTVEGTVVALRARADQRYMLEVAIPRDSGLMAGMTATIRLR